MTPSNDAPLTAGEQPTLLIFCPDIMFASRLQNLARHAGVRAVMMRPGQAIERGQLLVASFGRGDGWEQTIRDATQAGIPTIAFGPHVDADSRRIAKAAGAVRTVNNGNLERALIPVLQGLAGGGDLNGAVAALPDSQPQDD